MTALSVIGPELPRLSALARSLSAEEAATWTADEHARFQSEIRWCIDGLTELAARVAAVRVQITPETALGQTDEDDKTERWV
jgi:hypothetical protein